MRFDCVFFDFDGVIVENSQHLAFAALTEILQSYGLQIDYDYFIQHCLGKRGEEILVLLTQQYDLHIPAQALDQIRALHKNKLQVQSKINPNLPTVLSKLPKKYICSSSDLAYINKQLLIKNIKQYFPDEFIFSPQSRTDLKPSPRVYLDAIQHAGNNFTNCCAVEDSVIGVQAAKAAGLYTIGYVSREADSQIQKTLLWNAGVDEIIDDFLLLI